METLELVFGKATIRITSDDAMTTSEPSEQVAPATQPQDTPAPSRKSTAKTTKKTTSSKKVKKTDKKAMFQHMQGLIAGGDYKAAKAYVGKNAPQWVAQCDEACTRHSAKKGAVKAAPKKAAKKTVAKKAAPAKKGAAKAKAPAAKVKKTAKKKTTSSKSAIKPAEENVAPVSPPPVQEKDMADSKPATWLKGLEYPAAPTASGTRSYLKELREESGTADGELVNVENALDEVERMSDILSAAIDEAESFGATVAVTKLRQMFAAVEATHLQVLQDGMQFGADDIADLPIDIDDDVQFTEVELDF